MVRCTRCGVRELSGVPSMQRCSGCLHVSYCNAACQVADRPTHRVRCNTLKAQWDAYVAAPPSTHLIHSDEQIPWLQSSANDGNRIAMWFLGNMYLVGSRLIAADVGAAFRWFTRAVEGYLPPPGGPLPDIPYELGGAIKSCADCHYFGIGTPRDLKEAARLYSIAAEVGYSDATYKFGLCLQRGEGVEYDPFKGFSMMKCVTLLTDGGMEGISEQQYQVGVALETGHGVDEDPAAAVAYFRRSADQGHAAAMHRLGVCYAHGVGIARNPSAAVLWLKRALDADHWEAKDSLQSFVATLPPTEVPAMGVGVLRALLDGLGVEVLPEADKQALVTLVIVRGPGAPRRGG